MQVAIDEELLREARQVTGVTSEQALVEYGLRLVIAARKVAPVRSRSPATGQVGRACERLGASRIEAPDTPSVYRGPPLSLEAMDAAIRAEATRRR